MIYKIENLFKTVEKLVKKILTNRFLLYKTISLIAVIAIIGSGIWFFINKDNTEIASAGWYNDSWTRRAKITINADYTQGDLTDFPVLISTTSAYATGIASTSRSDGRDIIFTDATGTKLNREIEKFDKNSGELVAWVKAPSVASSTDTILYMYYGNPGYTEATSTGASFVWDSNYKAVHHLDGITVTDLDDSTNNDVDLTTAGGNPAYNQVGKIGNTVEFDGDDSLYGGNTVGITGSAVRTVEFWLKPAATGGDAFVSWGAGTTNNFYEISDFYNDDWSIHCYYCQWDSGVAVSTWLNIWSHHVVTFDGEYARWYINNALIGTSGSLPLDTGDSDIHIGVAAHSHSYPYTGLIDEIRISDSMRSTEYMATSYNNQNSPSTFLSWSTLESGGGPVAYWSFDEGYASTTYDRIGNNDGTLQSNTTWVDGKFGKALSFDGVNDYVSVGNSTVLDVRTGDYTITAWVKRSETGVVHMIVWDKLVSASNKGYLFGISSDDKLYSYLGDGSGTYVVNLQKSASAISTNWTYVVWTIDKDAYSTLYINGQIDGTPVAINNAVDITNTDATYIGNYNNSIYFTGLIDEVKIFNRALTYKEVAAEYASSGRGGGGVVLGQSFNRGKSGDPGTVTDGLVGYWKMDEASWGGTAGEVIDHSGMGNHGTSTNATSTTDQAKFGRSGGFDGTGDLIDVAAATSLTFTATDSFTVAGWFRLFSGASGPVESIISSNEDSTYSDDYLYAYAYDGSGNISFSGEGDGNTNSWSISYAQDYRDDTWHHFVGVHDGNTISLYTDGIKRVSDTHTAAGTYNSNGAWGIGDLIHHTSDRHLDGYIDDVKIYNRALSPNEVMREYISGPGPVGYWRFEEQSGTTAYDLSGNFNTGTLTGSPSWSSLGKVGGSMSFDGDGNGDYVNAGSNDILDDIAVITIEAWIYPRSWAGGAGRIITKAAVNADGFNLIVQNTTPDARLFLTQEWNNDGNETFVTDDDTVKLKEWQHIVLTYDRTSTSNLPSMYINGISYTVTNETGTPVGSLDSDAANDLWIGARNNGGTPDREFDGLIDEVKIYNYARTSRQIMQDFNGGSPVAYWSFDEGYASTTYDKIGIATTTIDGTLIDNTSWTDFGKFGKALSFDGSGDYVSVPHNSIFDFYDEDFSIGYWVYLRTNTVSGEYYKKPITHSDGATGGFNFYLGSSGGASGTLNQLFMNYITDPFGVYTKGVAATFNTNTWYHIYATKQGSTFKLFYNGAEVLTASDATLPVANNNVVLSIGSWYASGNQSVDGYLDEVKVYNYALTPEEISQEYLVNKGGPTGKTAAISIGDTRKQGKEYVVGGDGLVGYWKFDETTAWGATAGAVIDSSGAGNHGTSINATTTTDQAKFGRSAGFDGTGDYIDVADSESIDVNSQITMEAWVYPLNFADYVYAIWRNGDCSTMQYSIRIDITTGIITSYLCVDSSVKTLTSNTGISANTWSHLLVTYDGVNGKIYINGVEDSSQAISGSITTSAAALFIGSYSSGQYSVDGYIDDVKIYNRALNEKEVMREYVSGPAPVGYWRFEEQTGTTAYDLSGNFNTGTLANGPTWSAGGAVGGALKFDGVDDYINIGNNSSINITHPITIGAWVYPTGFNSYNTVIGKRDGASAVNYSFRINSNTTLEYYFADGSWRNFTTSYTFSANNWYYIAVTVNNSGDIIMYINGNNVGSFSTAFTPLTASNPLGIGSYHGDAAIELFKGIIDEVKIYNYARSARQIAYDYNGGKPVGHWKFDRGEGGTAYDASGQGNNGIIYPGTGGSNTATSTMWNNGVTGKINSAMDFDGTDDYVDIGSVSRLPTGSSSRTVSAWVYLDTTCTGGVVNSAGQFGIVTYGTYADSQMFGVQIDKATCELIFWGHTDDDFSGNQELTPYRWYHITSTFNGTTNKRYIDGVLDNQSTHSLTTGTTEGNIGRGASNEGDYFNGQIDDVRIYNYARTPEEVLIDYNGGAGVRF